MKGKDKQYYAGIAMMVLGGGALADHICYGVDAFPISAVVFGFGLIMVCESYRNG